MTCTASSHVFVCVCVKSLQVLLFLKCVYPSITYLQRSTPSLVWSSVTFRVNSSHKISKQAVDAFQKLLSNFLQAQTALLAPTSWIHSSNFFIFGIIPAFFYTSLLLLDLTSMRCVHVVTCGDRFFFLGLCYSIVLIFHQVLVHSKVGHRFLS